MRWHRLACVPVLFLTTLASAQAPQDSLARAEEAYMEVDFDRTYELASGAVEQGGQTVARLIRIYELMGVAAAAAGDEDASREAYIRMLAVSPDAQLDTNLAPRLRSPFMEARGFWATRSARLSADVVPVPGRHGLRVGLTDPLTMVDAVVVRSRLVGELSYSETRHDPSESFLVEVEGFDGAQRVEYFLVALDAHGNHVIEVGSADEPNVVGREPALVPEPHPEGSSSGGVLSSPWFWTVTVAVLAAGGVGAYYVLQERPITLSSQVSFD